MPVLQSFNRLGRHGSDVAMDIRSLLNGSTENPYLTRVGSHEGLLSIENSFVLHLMDCTFMLLPDSRGRKLDKVLMNDSFYFIGVQIAHLLKRETYNLYRTLKKHGVHCVKATTLQVQYLNSQNLPFVSKVHSVTLIPLHESLDYFRTGIHKIAFSFLFLICFILGFRRTETGKGQSFVRRERRMGL